MGIIVLFLIMGNAGFISSKGTFVPLVQLGLGLEIPNKKDYETPQENTHRERERGTRMNVYVCIYIYIYNNTNNNGNHQH